MHALSSVPGRPMRPGMTRLRRMLPATNLGRPRLAGLILGCLTVAPQLGQVGNPMNSAS
jgi:hypothetical protein